MVRIIDVHNHLHPREWMDYLEKSKGRVRMERTGPASMCFYVGDNILSRISNIGHYDVKARVADLDKCGIDTQMLSLTVPSVEFLPADEGVKWARKVNDYFAEVCHKYPGRFYALATLPYQDVGEAVKELERACKKLGVKGITIFSNIDGRPLASPEFYPIYAKAEEYGLPIFLHPGVPYTVEITKKLKLSNGLYAFTLDTSMAVVSLIWQGVLEKFPGLNIIHSHLGGVVPYTVQRMEDSWRVHAKTLGLKLSLTPSEYYKRQVYPDSMSAYLPAMRCCLEFVGSSHICLGTDYPHGIGNWEQAIDYVRRLGLPEEETNNILGGNAARIFKLE